LCHQRRRVDPAADPEQQRQLPHGGLRGQLQPVQPGVVRQRLRRAQEGARARSAAAATRHGLATGRLKSRRAATRAAVTLTLITPWWM